MKQELHEMFVADQFLIPSTAELGVTKKEASCFKLASRFLAPRTEFEPVTCRLTAERSEKHWSIGFL